MLLNISSDGELIVRGLGKVSRQGEHETPGGRSGINMHKEERWPVRLIAYTEHGCMGLMFMTRIFQAMFRTFS